MHLIGMSAVLVALAPADGFSCDWSHVGGHDLAIVGGKLGAQRLGTHAKAQASRPGSESAAFPQGLADEDVLPKFSVIQEANVELGCPVGEPRLFELGLPASGRVGQHSHSWVCGDHFWSPTPGLYGRQGPRHVKHTGFAALAGQFLFDSS